MDKYSQLIIHYDSSIEDKVFELFNNLSKLTNSTNSTSSSNGHLKYFNDNNNNLIKITNKYYDCAVQLNRIHNTEDCLKIKDIDGLIYFFTAETLNLKVIVKLIYNNYTFNVNSVNVYY